MSTKTEKEAQVAKYPCHSFGDPTEQLSLSTIIEHLQEIAVPADPSVPPTPFRYTIDTTCLTFDRDPSRLLPTPGPILLIKELVLRVSEYYVEEQNRHMQDADGPLSWLIQWILVHANRDVLRLCVLELGSNDPYYHPPSRTISHSLNLLTDHEWNKRNPTHIILDCRKWNPTQTYRYCYDGVQAFTVSVNNIYRSQFGEIVKQIKNPQCIRAICFPLYHRELSVDMFRGPDQYDLASLSEYIMSRPSLFQNLKNFYVNGPKWVNQVIRRTAKNLVRENFQDIQGPLGFYLTYKRDDFVPKGCGINFAQTQENLGGTPGEEFSDESDEEI